MSTTTPPDETWTRTETRTTTGTGRPDPWADATADSGTGVSATAPRTFDPLCIRRLRNCFDRENAAFPDAG